MNKALRWSWLLVVAAMIYVAFVFWMRHRENRRIEESAVRQEAKADREVLSQLGGGEMKILMFYASPPKMERGTKGLLCYGVASAESVEIKPRVEDIRPSLSRCVEVRPTENTVYTLTAKDARGRVETRNAEIVVR